MAYELPELQKWLEKVFEHDAPRFQELGRDKGMKSHFAMLSLFADKLSEKLMELEISARVAYASEHGHDGFKWTDEFDKYLKDTLFGFMTSVISMFHSSGTDWVAELNTAAKHNLDDQLAREQVQTIDFSDVNSVADFLENLLGDKVKFIDRDSDDEPTVEEDGTIRPSGKSFNV